MLGRAARSSLAAAALLAMLGAPRAAHAVDLPKVKDKPLRLDVTETSVMMQRFDARSSLNPRDYGWGTWLNKLNAQLTWGRWTVGARLDSSLYWRRPIDRSLCAEGCKFNESDRASLESANTSRYRDSLMLAKAWATYKAPGVEVTVGDAYAQFGRGLVLSMRKVDELGVDTTVRGAKVSIQKDPIALQLLAGFANPTRVDEASGTSLMLSRPYAGEVGTERPLFGSDRVFGAEITAGRGTPILSATRVAHFQRCAPYAYDAQGGLDRGVRSSAFGSCQQGAVDTWLGGLSGALNPLLRARGVTLVGQSFEVPDLWGHGKLYVEGALQSHDAFGAHDADRNQGNALYASLVNFFGPLTTTLEVKSNRNFYAVPAAVDATRAIAFTSVQYTNLPTTEPLISDAMFGFFNACVNGGRLRADVRLTPQFLVYGAGGYYHSRSESVLGGCDRFGRQIGDNRHGEADNYVWDGQSGIEWRFDRDRSQVLLSTGARNDTLGSGALYYRERSLNYSVSIFLKGPYSFELYGRHRIREQENENLRIEGTLIPVPWGQGFHTTALKIAPKWVIAQGVEYFALLGQPATYLNGQLLYRFTGESNVKLLVGQQQGGLRCVSGVCRVFPAFEGVRAELTLRF